MKRMVALSLLTAACAGDLPVAPKQPAIQDQQSSALAAALTDAERWLGLGPTENEPFAPRLVGLRQLAQISDPANHDFIRLQALGLILDGLETARRHQ